jgi:hypothetical protein
VGLLVRQGHVQDRHPVVHVRTAIPAERPKFTSRFSRCIACTTWLRSGSRRHRRRASACSTPQTIPTRCLMERYSCTTPLLLLPSDPCALSFVLLCDMLCMAVADYPIGFVAKSTLFDLPIMGTLLRWAGAIPVHRAQDAPASSSGGVPRASANKNAFGAISARLRQNGRVAIFPEGISHMESHVMPLCVSPFPLCIFVTIRQVHRHYPHGLGCGSRCLLFFRSNIYFIDQRAC